MVRWSAAQRSSDSESCDSSRKAPRQCRALSDNFPTLGFAYCGGNSRHDTPDTRMDVKEAEQKLPTMRAAAAKLQKHIIELQDMDSEQSGVMDDAESDHRFSLS